MDEARPTISRAGRSTKRAAIIEAATVVFLRQGVAQAKVDTIATEAGVSKQTIYNNFGDKENLLLAVIDRTLEQGNGKLFTALRSFPADPADLAAELTDFALLLTRSCLVDSPSRALRALVYAEAARSPWLVEEWRLRGPGQVTAALAEQLGRLDATGHVDAPDPELAAQQFLALITCDSETGAGQVDLEKTVSQGVGAFLRAYAPRAAPVVPPTFKSRA